MAGGGGMSSDVSGIERLLVNFNIGGVRNCFSSSVTPIDVCRRIVPFGKPRKGPLGLLGGSDESTAVS